MVVSWYEIYLYQSNNVQMVKNCVLYILSKTFQLPKEPGRPEAEFENGEKS